MKSECMNCGCSTSRLIYCSDCDTVEKRLRKALVAANPANKVKRKAKPKKPAVKVTTMTTVTFERSPFNSNLYLIKSIGEPVLFSEGILNKGSSVLCKSVNLTSSAMCSSTVVRLIESGIAHLG